MWFFLSAAGCLKGAFLIAVVTLHTFALGKFFKCDRFFPKVTYLGEILSSGTWICHENKRVSLDSYMYPKAKARANSNPKVTNQGTLIDRCIDDRAGNL